MINNYSLRFEYRYLVVWYIWSGKCMNYLY